MSVLKSDAAVSGLMPDFTQVGVVLCRTGTYLFASAQAKTFCTGTIQMVPIPNGAMILGWQLQYNSTISIAGITQNDLGFGDDPDYLMADFNMQTADILEMVANGVLGRVGAVMTKDDTIDITINKLPTKIPTNSELVLNVFYKMTGTISDEG